jgi:type I restriction enzyme, S subunit
MGHMNAHQGDSRSGQRRLLKRIAAEKSRLVNAGEVRNKLSLPPVESSDQPHPIPSHWMWVRFGNIVDFSAGRTPSRNDASFWNTGDYPWVSIADMADGQVVERTKETVSERARREAFRSEPEPPGTMIMSFKLTIGKIARLGISSTRMPARP